MNGPKNFEKAQAAIEFIFSYGWAIMIVLVAIGSLAYFGVLDLKSILPQACIIEPGIGCIDAKIDSSMATFVLQNGLSGTVNLSKISIEGCACPAFGSLDVNEKGTFIVSGCGNNPGGKFRSKITVEYVSENGLRHSKTGTVSALVEDSTGPVQCNFVFDGPLDESRSEFTANINSSLPADWNGAKGGDNNIVMKLFSDVSYDIYLDNFTLAWNDSSNSFKHFQHLTASNGWSKIKIYGDVSQPSIVTGVFDGQGDDFANLRIPANSMTIIDDMHFDNDISLPTEFNLTLHFNDSASSTMRFTIS